VVEKGIARSVAALTKHRLEIGWRAERELASNCGAGAFVFAHAALLIAEPLLSIKQTTRAWCGMSVASRSMSPGNECYAPPCQRRMYFFASHFICPRLLPVRTLAPQPALGSIGKKMCRSPVCMSSQTCRNGQAKVGREPARHD
jgi:hypothetical protein